ncbi:iron-sulfur cluster assembly protein [Streptomyces sp. MK7]|uniref:iron-sulfur cluster assembly protein n=1 Tax=Streptomyces sp. MK7 TaxID=3067635 RepID=UPI00292EA613|nr:iron-sulfur cluster assembly protein [Streptomyces sp. MK7]
MTLATVTGAPVTGPAEQSAGVIAALATVLDPDRGRPITELGIVRRVSIDGGRVAARLRLPAHVGGPDLARLTADDARRALAVLTWVTDVTVDLEDHSVREETCHPAPPEEEFTAASPLHSGPGQAERPRSALPREDLLAVQGRLGRHLVSRGWTCRQMAGACLKDLPGRLTEALVRCRRTLGLPADDSDPVFIDERGRAVLAVEIEPHLRR